jgi:hypothetical protein
MSFPTHCHLDGELFIFRMVGPRETSLCNLVYERDKGVMAQDKSVLSQITANNEIVKEMFHC